VSIDIIDEYSTGGPGSKKKIQTPPQFRKEGSGIRRKISTEPQGSFDIRSSHLDICRTVLSLLQYSSGANDFFHKSIYLLLLLVFVRTIVVAPFQSRRILSVYDLNVHYAVALNDSTMTIGENLFVMRVMTGN
jgi:hypothetical protein